VCVLLLRYEQLYVSLCLIDILTVCVVVTAPTLEQIGEQIGEIIKKSEEKLEKKMEEELDKRFVQHSPSTRDPTNEGTLFIKQVDKHAIENYVKDELITNKITATAILTVTEQLELASLDYEEQMVAYLTPTLATLLNDRCRAIINSETYGWLSIHDMVHPNLTAVDVDTDDEPPLTDYDKKPDLW
jgi:hypothetical protein